MPVLTDQQMLEAMIANDTEPILSADTITTLLMNCQVRDHNQLMPGETDYTPTYDLNRAAARGWRLKAAKVAADYDVDVDGHGMTRSQMIDHFLTMASAYAKIGGPRVRHIGVERRGSRWY